MAKAGLLLNTQYLLECQEVLGVTIDTEALWKVLGDRVGVGFKQKIAVCVEGDLGGSDEAEFLKKLKLSTYRVDRAQVVDREPHCQNRKCKYNRENSLRLNCLVPTCPFSNKALGIKPGRARGIGVSLATRMMQLCYRQDVRTFIVLPGDAPLESCFDVLTNDESVSIYLAYFSNCGDVAPELKSFAAGTFDLSDPSLLASVTLKGVAPPSTIPAPPPRGTTSKPLTWEQQAADLAANESLFFMDFKAKDKKEEEKPKEPTPEPKKELPKNNLFETLAMMPEPPLPPTTTVGSAPPPIPGGPSFDFFMDLGLKKEEKKPEPEEEPKKEKEPEKPVPSPVNALPPLPMPLPKTEAEEPAEKPETSPKPEPQVKQQAQPQYQPINVQPQQQQQPAQHQMGAQQGMQHSPTPQQSMAVPQQQQQQQPQQQPQPQPQQQQHQQQQQPLPPNWSEVFDPNTRKPYYVYTDPHTRSQKTTWERPKPQPAQQAPHVQQQISPVPQQPQQYHQQQQYPVQQMQQFQGQGQPQMQQHQMHMQQQQQQQHQQQGYSQQGQMHVGQQHGQQAQMVEQEMQQIQHKLLTYTEALKRQGVAPSLPQQQAIEQLKQRYQQLFQQLQTMQR